MANTGPMTLQEYFAAIGLRTSEVSIHIEKLTGVRVTRKLLDDAIHYKESERQPLAAPKAEALCKFLSAEMGRKVTIQDVKGLKVV